MFQWCVMFGRIGRVSLVNYGEMATVYGPGDAVLVMDPVGRAFVYHVNYDGGLTLFSEPHLPESVRSQIASGGYPGGDLPPFEPEAVRAEPDAVRPVTGGGVLAD